MIDRAASEPERVLALAAGQDLTYPKCFGTEAKFLPGWSEATENYPSNHDLCAVPSLVAPQ